MSDAVILEVGGPIARVTLSQPDAFNAMNREPLDSDDFREGVSAFFDKRQPRFTGA